MWYIPLGQPLLFSRSFRIGLYIRVHSKHSFCFHLEIIQPVPLYFADKKHQLITLVYVNLWHETLAACFRPNSSMSSHETAAARNTGVQAHPMGLHEALADAKNGVLATVYPIPRRKMISLSLITEK